MRSVYLLSVVATMLLIIVTSYHNAVLVDSRVISLFWWFLIIMAGFLTGYTLRVWGKEILEGKYRLTFLADARHGCTVMATGASYFFGSDIGAEARLGEFGSILWTSMGFVFAVFSGIFLLTFFFPQYANIGNNQYEAIKDTTSGGNRTGP